MRWILFSLSVIAAFGATTLMRSDFSNGPGTWVSMGEHGAVHVIREGDGLRDGKPSLAFDYEIGARKFAAAVMPVEVGSLAAMDQVHFWVKTDYPTPVAIFLSEKAGGNYSAVAWSPGGLWQEVKLEPHDFALGERPNDPPDPDGKLDLDQLQGVGLADLGQLFGGAPPNPAVPIAMTSHPGRHTLLISGFEVLSGASPERRDNLLIDDFGGPQVSWFSPGGASFRLDASREHAPGPAMEVSYDEVEGAIVFFARNLPPGIPANITHISFDIASEKPAQFVFGLQQHGAGHGEGPRYNTTVEVRGGGKPDHRELALSAFNLDASGPSDTQKELKISSAKSMTIADISAAANGGHGPNKVWLSNLRLIARE